MRRIRNRFCIRRIKNNRHFCLIFGNALIIKSKNVINKLSSIIMVVIASVLDVIGSFISSYWKFNKYDKWNIRVHLF